MLAGNSYFHPGAAACHLTAHGPQSLLPLTCPGMERPGTGAEGQIYELVLRSGGLPGTFTGHLTSIRTLSLCQF